MRNNYAIVEAYTRPFSTVESRIGILEMPRQITKAKPWLEQLETKLPLLANTSVEFIFGQLNHATGTLGVISHRQ